MREKGKVGDMHMGEAAAFGSYIDRVKQGSSYGGFPKPRPYGHIYCETCKQYKRVKKGEKTHKGWKCADCRRKERHGNDTGD